MPKGFLGGVLMVLLLASKASASSMPVSLSTQEADEAVDLRSLPDETGRLPELTDLLKKAGLHLDNVQMPRRIKYVEPRNPVDATAADFPGIVVLHCRLSVKGQVESCDSKREPSEVLKDSAIEAVKQWRYTPFRLRGTPTSLWFTVVVKFTL